MPLDGSPNQGGMVYSPTAGREAPSGSVYLACERCLFPLRFLIEYQGKKLCRRCLDDLRRGARP